MMKNFSLGFGYLRFAVFIKLILDISAIEHVFGDGRENFC